MKIRTACIYLSLYFALSAVAQQPAPVPRVTYFSGAVKDAAGAPQTGIVGIAFALYEEPQGGTALWTEIQNVPLDDQGRYTALLGSMQPEGLPQDLFSSGRARWLGVTPQVPGVAEQPRVLLVGVPYALKAADADTLGGLPASAFLQAAAPATSPQAGPARISGVRPEAVTGASPDTACAGLTSDGTAAANQVAKFTAPCNLEPSAIVETGGKVGIGIAAPANVLDVNGNASIRGSLLMLAKGTATAAAGANSNPIDLLAESFSSITGAWVNEHFRWQAEATGNNTSHPSASVNLLYATGLAMPAETGLSINAAGLLTFAPGQTFPGTGVGTVTGVAAGADLTGGGTSGTVTLGLDTTKVPLLAAANTFANSQKVTGELTVTGLVNPDYANSNGGSLAPGLQFGNPTGEGIASKRTATGNQYGLDFYTDFTPRLSIMNGGSVGIGTQSPGALLDVEGVPAPAGAAAVNALNVVGGTGGSSSGGTIAGQGANVTIQAGPGGNNSSGLSGQGGNVTIQAGAGGDLRGTGGSITLQSGVGGTGGDLELSGFPGYILLAPNGAYSGVGIGTGAPYGALQINNSGWTTNILVGQNNGSTVLRVDDTGKGFFDGGTQTGGADFAESVAVRGQRSLYEPGDLLAIDASGTRRLALARDPYSAHVAGVYSTKPGVLATPHTMDDSRLQDEVPLAVVGIVPCKVTAKNGPIQVGDMLVSSSLPGYAMKGTARRKMLGAVVGKALEPLREGTGVIQVLVTLQ